VLRLDGIALTFKWGFDRDQMLRSGPRPRNVLAESDFPAARSKPWGTPQMNGLRNGLNGVTRRVGACTSPRETQQATLNRGLLATAPIWTPWTQPPPSENAN
jgi:hypothetical protein